MNSDNLSNIKINYIDGRYWIVPSIFTLSRRKWASFPFKNLDLMFEKLELNILPVTLNFNGDVEFIHFNNIQKKHGLNIKLENKELNKNSTISFKIFNNLFINLDYKSLKLIKKGLFFSCPKHYYENLLLKLKILPNEKLTITWRRNYFIIDKGEI
ncbi:MPN499 family protein [Mycoplasma elephantis]|uniref:MPN499 family protein n=1 Tax=Mycoplasma elephantis TaxID=114882 RepID=UPI000485F606|nr:hypothetical protein [Mycoplasma elephantis]